MKQHPVPQNISSYQFRLVGDMTLKQFLELAAGLVLGYLCFHLSIPDFIKFPLILFFCLTGFALAFLPIQGRSLDKWIINFIKSVYSPTRFLWRKKNQPPVFLQSRTKMSTKTTVKAVPKKDKTILKEYLQTFTPVASSASPLDEKEKKQLENINNLLIAPASPPASPFLSVSQSSPVAEIKETFQKPIIKPAPPLTPPIRVESNLQIEQKVKPEVAAMFPNQIPMPSPSEAPNIVVGMVLTPDERILSNAIVEIKDSQNNTIRALKTNKLGQFFTAGPLTDGDYRIKGEHNSYQFNIINLKAEGKIIPPVKIKARSAEINSPNY